MPFHHETRQIDIWQSDDKRIEVYATAGDGKRETFKKTIALRSYPDRILFQDDDGNSVTAILNCEQFRRLRDELNRYRHDDEK